MASKEMIQKSGPSSPAHPSTPPNSPDLRPPQLVITLGVMAASTLPAKQCCCSNTPPESPDLQASSLLVGFENLEQVLLRAIEAASKSRDSSSTAEPDTPEDAQAETEIFPGLKVEFKMVNEVWDEKAHQYKVVESLKPKDAITELDQYVFVVRVRIDRDTEELTSYIDIKSELLRDILRTVLKEVHGINLREDKPTVEADLLYHYLPELESHRRNLNDDLLPDKSSDGSSGGDPSDGDSSDSGSSDDDSPSESPDAESHNPESLKATCKDHLDLLIDYIRKTYGVIRHCLSSHLESKEITYDLLWALFKPGALVYTTCPGTRKPRCVIYDFGEERKSKFGVKYYHIECRYLDFNGKVFGEVSVELPISKFHGTKCINTLEAFPLQYHPNRSAIRAYLLKCGRKFVSLIGTHHRYCCGKAFFMRKGDAIQFSVNSRIMIDAAFFWKVNPNYSRPRITESVESELELSGLEFAEDGMFIFGQSESEPADQIRSCGKEPARMNEDDLLICCPTVLGFSLNDKIWAEFAVADIKDIEWSNSLFNCLSIPNEQRDAIMALAETHMGEAQNVPFDDFFAGKGRGLVILLHGPPGVGKTLTAEAVSEHFKRPLYSISAGELQTTAEELERQLTRISESAKRWKALLLLDEADVYVEQRLTNDLVRNSLVSVFLRKLEYCEGIMFLTTNRVSQFDAAILSRIHLMFKYDNLTKEAGRQIWNWFIEKAHTTKGPVEVKPEELDCLVNNQLNGRQIKNVMAVAHALATKQKSPVRYSHLQTAVDACKAFIGDLNGS